MVRAELLGSHSHQTLSGTRVNIWSRSGKLLARGYFHGQHFGETLGGDVTTATARLHELLAELENGTFIRPSEARSRMIAKGRVPKLILSDLTELYLAEKRKTRGRGTAETYLSRLRPTLEFAEQAVNRKKWPLAWDIDHDFAVQLRAFLYRYQTTRNGRPGGSPKPMSTRQIYNVLECVRDMLNWARRVEIRKLPTDWANPFTLEIVGRRPRKDPLRPDLLPLELRTRLVEFMDRWQFCHLSLSLVLPLRPGEAIGLLISDVNFDKGWLEFRTRLHGSDFTKEQTEFVLPFPPELRPILLACVGGRAEGPLLRSRKIFEQGDTNTLNHDELEARFREKLVQDPADTQQDRKAAFRQFLHELGGATEDELAKEFKRAMRAVGCADDVPFYESRHSVTTSMGRRWPSVGCLPYLNDECRMTRE